MAASNTLAGHAQVSGRPCNAYVQIFVEQSRVQRGKLVNANEEHRFELQALNVLNIEHKHITLLAHPLPVGSDDLNVVLNQGSIQRFGH